MKRSLLAVLLLGHSLAACAEDPPPCPVVEEGEGLATGSICDSSTLTYENFGRQFMENYCTHCHSSSLDGQGARHCAPADHNYDTLEALLPEIEHIDGHAAGGPEGLNDAMPPASEKQPSTEERIDLGTWLACERERL